MRRTNRDLEKDRSGLERQEKQIVSEEEREKGRQRDREGGREGEVCRQVDHMTSSNPHPQEAEIKKAAKRGDKQV